MDINDEAKAQLIAMYETMVRRGDMKQGDTLLVNASDAHLFLLPSSDGEIQFLNAEQYRDTFRNTSITEVSAALDVLPQPDAAPSKPAAAAATSAAEPGVAGPAFETNGRDPVSTPAAEPEKPADTIAVVKPGDNLWNMVKDHFGLTSNRDVANKLKEVQKLNGMDDKQAGKIKPGQEIILEKAPEPAKPDAVAQAPADPGETGGTPYIPVDVAEAPPANVIMDDDPAAVAQAPHGYDEVKPQNVAEAPADPGETGGTPFIPDTVVAQGAHGYDEALALLDHEQFVACFAKAGEIDPEMLKSCFLDAAKQPAVEPQPTMAMNYTTSMGMSA